MNIKLIVIALLALFVLAGCSSTGNVAGTEKPVVKIGVTVPLTGDVAFLGEGARNALELALSDLEDTKYQYEFIIEDDKLDPKLTSTAINKLISVDEVDALLSLSSGTGNVVTPVAEANKIIHFGIASDPNVAHGMYNFIHWTTPEEEASKWVQEAQKRGYKRIASIFVQQQGAVAVLDELKKQFEGTEMAFVSDQTFAFGEKDFKTMILKAKTSNPDVYFAGAFSPEIDLLYRQLKELGIEKPVSTIEAFELSNDPSQFEGEWYVNAAESSGEFIVKYKARYDIMPTMGTPNMYDNFNLIVEGFERAGDGITKPTTEQVAHAISQIRGFPGVLGNLDVGEEGIVWSPAVIRMIKDGKPVTISE